MPGREASAPRGGAQASTPARRLHAPYASRRRPGSHTTRPGLVAVQLTGATPSKATSTASASGQRSPVPAEAASTCSRCAACLKASQEVLQAYNALLRNSKRLFIDDALHHYSGDEAWIRVLRSLGWSDDRVAACGAGCGSGFAQR
ncbi:hypothetical protein LSCM4_05898 [Leishmania orientalis]|uniref:Uncharacterized protein n=1 Tax=Leishmania orientalis TaxID=2249476 RepID=A0A836HN78_9TRYP|nr:hypothetical protein LSCM4_05898 [Leishmania orientalis]